MEQEDTIDYNIRKTWFNITKMYNRSAIDYKASTSLAMIVLNVNIYDTNFVFRELIKIFDVI